MDLFTLWCDSFVWVHRNKIISGCFSTAYKEEEEEKEIRKKALVSYTKNVIVPLNPKKTATAVVHSRP